MGVKFKQIVRNHLYDFLRTNNKLFYNERDFQINLAFFLKNTNYYDNVLLEYSLPASTMLNFSDIRIDIVLVKENLYFPIELKYKTKKVLGELNRFGETFSNVEVLKNQAAQNIGRYSFWKDVSRLEVVKKNFAPNIEAGFCIFLTNDIYYQKSPQGASGAFTMEAGTVLTGNINWKTLVTIADYYPAILFKGKYKIEKWDNVKNEGIDFYYTIVEV